MQDTPHFPRTCMLTEEYILTAIDPSSFALPNNGDLLLLWAQASSQFPLTLGSPLLSHETSLLSPSGCLHIASPSLLPRTDSKAWFSGPSYLHWPPPLSVSGCSVLDQWDWCSSLSLLCPLQSGCWAFLWGFEFPPFWVISQPVRWFPKV